MAGRDGWAAALVDPAVRASDIVSQVSLAFNLRPHELLEHRRDNANAVLARKVAAYLVRKHAGLSLPAIGRLLERDHSTVMYGIHWIEKHLPRRPDLAAIIFRLTGALQGQGAEGAAGMPCSPPGDACAGRP